MSMYSLSSDSGFEYYCKGAFPVKLYLLIYLLIYLLNIPWSAALSSPFPPRPGLAGSYPRQMESARQIDSCWRLPIYQLPPPPSGNLGVIGIGLEPMAILVVLAFAADKVT